MSTLPSLAVADCHVLEEMAQAVSKNGKPNAFGWVCAGIASVTVIGGIIECLPTRKPFGYGRTDMIETPTMFDLPEVLPVVVLGTACIVGAGIAALLAVEIIGNRRAQRKATARLQHALPDNATQLAEIAAVVNGRPCHICEEDRREHEPISMLAQTVWNEAIIAKAETWLECAGTDMPIEDEILIKEAMYRALRRPATDCPYREADIYEEMELIYKRLSADPRNQISRADFPAMREQAIANLQNKKFHFA